MNKSILIVDDEKDLADTIANLLRCNGYNAFSAYGRSEALKCLQENKIDILLTDYKFPDGGGPRLVTDIKTTLSYLPRIIFYSGYLDEVEKQIITKGNNFMEKPFTLRKLMTLLEDKGALASKSDQVNKSRKE